MLQPQKSITWQFSTSDAEISSLIRWKTDSEISHVDVVTPEGKLLGAHIEDGVRVRDFNYSKFTLRIFVIVPVSDEQYAAFWAYVNSQVGCEYDKAGIIGIALGRNICAPGEVFCSELQTRGVEQARIVHIAKDASKVDPEMLRVVLTAIPGAQEKRNFDINIER
jgi:hypothetical protein